MKKVVTNYGGIILFYLVIIFGLFFLENGNKKMSNTINNEYLMVEKY